MDVNIISQEKCCKWAEYVKDELIAKTFGLINITTTKVSSQKCVQPLFQENNFLILVLDQTFLDLIIKMSIDWRYHKENVFFVCLGQLIHKVFKENQSVFSIKVEETMNSVCVIYEDVSNVTSTIETICVIIMKKSRIYENLVLFPTVATLTDELGICLPTAHNRQTLRLQFVATSHFVANERPSIYELSALPTNSAFAFQISKEDLNKVMEHIGCGEFLVKAILPNSSSIKSNFKLISLEIAARRLDINKMNIDQVIESFKKWKNTNIYTQSNEYMLLGNFMDERLACCVQMLKSSLGIKNVSHEGSLLHFATKHNLRRTVHAILTNSKTVDLMLLHNDEGLLPLDMSEDVDICEKMKKFRENYKFVIESESIYSTMSDEKIDNCEVLEYLVPKQTKNNKNERKIKCQNVKNSDIFSAQLIDIESRLREGIIPSMEGHDQVMRWLKNIRLEDDAEAILETNKNTLDNIYSLLKVNNSNKARELPELPSRKPSSVRPPPLNRSLSDSTMQRSPILPQTKMKVYSKKLKGPPCLPPRKKNP